MTRQSAVPTAPVAAAALIVGFAVAVSTGSRPLGGVVLALGGVWCIRQWLIRHDRQTAIALGCVGFAAFVLSHLIALAIGAWPSVLLCASALAAVVRVRADSRKRASAVYR
ncbi:MAG TPA: hypothetical protein VFR48_01070 [Solirubrobacteraceae bacterium]|nr:hypothetical protein [Solirubrobacteraceae bacterium]